MSRSTTKALGAFTVNLQRAQYFVELHELWHSGPGRPPKQLAELPRGAVVFAVGAFDAFLSDWSAEVIVDRLANDNPAGDSRQILAQIQRDLPSLALEVALLPNSQQRIDSIKTAVAEHFYKQESNHGPAAVARAVTRAGGQVQSFWQGVNDVLNSDAAALLTSWTDKRNRIVHRGETVKVRREDARSCTRVLGTLGSHLDGLF